MHTCGQNSNPNTVSVLTNLQTYLISERLTLTNCFQNGCLIYTKGKTANECIKVLQHWLLPLLWWWSLHFQRPFCFLIHSKLHWIMSDPFSQPVPLYMYDTKATLKITLNKVIWDIFNLFQKYFNKKLYCTIMSLVSKKILHQHSQKPFQEKKKKIRDNISFKTVLFCFHAPKQTKLKNHRMVL